MENEYSSLITNLGGQVYQKAEPFRETGEDRKVNVVSNIPKNYTPTTYELSGNILVFTLSPELKNLYPNSTARLGDKTVSIQTLESPLEVKVEETIGVNINWGDRYIETFTIYNPKIEVEPGPEPDPRLKIPFYVENIGSETNTFGIFIDVWQDEPVQFTFEISGDGKTWEEYTIDTSSGDPYFAFDFTEKLYVRAKTNTYYVYNEVEDSGYHINIGCANDFSVGGNTMSLLYGSEFTGNETVFPQDSSCTFSCLFSEIPTLVSAKDLILPATTLTEYCYTYMFSGCTSLTEAPELPATTLSDGCYEYMFGECTSLTSAPELTSTTLAEGCYVEMFAGCTSLESVIVYVTGNWDQLSTYNWLSDVAPDGTLYNLGGATGIPEEDISGCPNGWTIETTPPGPEPPQPEILDYFWITPEEDAKIVVKFGNLSYCDYSIDQVLWKSLWDNDLIIPANTKIYLRANTINEHEWSFSVTKNNSENARFNVGGNIMSLVYSKNFVKNTEFPTQDYSFGWFFTETSVVDASELVLPANHLTMECYAGMFSDCTSLTSAPELPATELANGCYRQMFDNCTSLTSAPELPAMNLAEECYHSMFYYCTSLTEAPELPAESLASKCYNYMFLGCTLLEEAPQLPATDLAEYCYSGMFEDCTSLTTTPELPATTLAKDCYSQMFGGCIHLISTQEIFGTTLVDGCYRTMFSGCSSLNSIKIHIEGQWRTSITTNWLAGVAQEGILYNLGGATGIPTDSNAGCPTGWHIETELPQE